MNFFPRPTREAPPRPPASRAVGPTPPPAAAPDMPCAPDPRGTVFALIGIAFTAATLHGWQPSAIARYAAICTMVSLSVSVWFDFKRGLRNLQRADIFAILAYYFLTLFEFLFPQPNFDVMLSAESTIEGLHVCLLGFAGLLIGRHLLIPKKQPFRKMLTHDIPRGWMLVIFWASFAVGFANMLVAVNFDVRMMIDFFMAPRFTQPWTRERLGSWSSMVYELGMLIQLIPPLGGIILARRQRYPVIHLLLVCAGLGLTFFYGFSSGTRNVFATYLVTFLIGYSLALPPHRTREMTILSVVSAVIMFFATYYMLQFREVGLKNYLQGKWTPPPASQKSLFVDYNLFSICKLVEFFPRSHDYLGWEIPYQAIIRPIPRALWKDKPTGLSMTIEDALNVDGLTISASFAGEAYMSGGLVPVFVLALVLGAFMGWWGGLSSLHNSEVGHLIYASGFLSAVISMRSLFVFTTALLPTAAAVVVTTFAVNMLIKQGRKLLLRARPVPRRAPGRRMPPQPVRRP